MSCKTLSETGIFLPGQTPIFYTDDTAARVGTQLHDPCGFRGAKYMPVKPISVDLNLDSLRDFEIPRSQLNSLPPPWMMTMS